MIDIPATLARLGIGPMTSGVFHRDWVAANSGPRTIIHSPATGETLGTVRMAEGPDYETAVNVAAATFERWRMTPAPMRGEVIRDIAQELRAAKEDLAALITIESGKIYAESLGEVQDMIDVAGFAAGLSRQLYGLTMPSERPGHRMFEQWHPLGVIGVISAFNFPAAVWSWNAFIAAVCGDTVVWKPSEKTPLTAIAIQRICDRVLEPRGWRGVFTLVNGPGSSIGEAMIADRRIALLSATGSTRMGRRVAQGVAARLGRTLLELGGNNGLIVMDDANLDLALRAVVFGAAGTAGQRCTSIRRLFLQKGIAAKFTEKLIAAYMQIRVGHPMASDTLVGPLIDRAAVTQMQLGLASAREQGGEVLCGGHPVETDHAGRALRGGCYVAPALVHAPRDLQAMQHELFAPVLYIVEFDTLDEAIWLHNGVPQGLSSAIFTTSLLSSEAFLSAQGSDCGIANVNIATSGAEVGGAFGGEKETGGGRESGSDAWKAYVRRQTVTINGSNDLPLAQGIRFDL